MQHFGTLLRQNVYPGRGIALGKTPDGTAAVMVYFIMGRSENSRNRVFVEEGSGIRTQAYDPAKVEDPSLILYAPVRVLPDGTTIVTNGDQTDTIYECLQSGGSWEEALRSRTFEPDAPNYTPRISGLVSLKNDQMHVRMAILKSDQGDPTQCLRQFFDYEAIRNGEGFFLSTYQGDGNPLPSFTGEPIPIAVSDEIEQFTQEVWEGLNSENRVSLWVRYLRLQDLHAESRIVNGKEQSK